MAANKKNGEATELDLEHELPRPKANEARRLEQA